MITMISYAAGFLHLVGQYAEWSTGSANVGRTPPELLEELFPIPRSLVPHHVPPMFATDVEVVATNYWIHHFQINSFPPQEGWQLWPQKCKRKKHRWQHPQAFLIDLLALLSLDPTEAATAAQEWTDDRRA